MEAVPKLPLISFQLKVSPETTHFGPILKQFISEAYHEDPDSYSNEMHQLESLRSAAVRPTSDSAGLNALTRYFCQLRAMQSRFPMAKGQPAACSFTWKDLYAGMNCSLPDIKFEMGCILYNIGALHTQLGASEPRNTADSLKSACTHYQNAAWAFQYVREQYAQPPGEDLCMEIMRLMQEICFAQAQECILDKSIQDTRKSSVVGAVATQVLLFYKNSLAHLGPSIGTDNIHEIIGTKLYNYWHRYLSFKASYIGCIVCLYQGMNAEEQQKMGERVAFYQIAVDKLNDARKLAKYIEPVQITQEALTFTNDVVEGKRKAAKNENEFIYHEEVPDKDLLGDLKPVCLVKVIAINFNDPEIAGPDIFSRLVPIGAHEASSLYSEEKAKLLRLVGGRADAKNTELIEFMSSLQLDQLAVLDSDQTIPQEIVDRCAAMNAKSDIIQTLVDSMNSLAEIISDVENSLGDIKSLIQEESTKEKEYQKIMGPRPPSIVQTELSREFYKYQEAHTRTNESNQVLHKAMTLHIANLRLLAQPLDVLQAKIPSIDNIEGLDRETMSEMRRVVAKVKEMQMQRELLLQQLREEVANDDITTKLLARSNEPAQDIFKEELEKYMPKVEIIDQNLAAQENIINRLTSLYAQYGESRRLLSDVLRKREGLINALITSYDTHEELLGKCQKGLEFYKKLAHNVNQLLARVRSTCQVQEEEREQLLAKQSSNVVPPTSVAPVSSKTQDMIPNPISQGATPKLKDYLPYMKNRGFGVKPDAPHVPMVPMIQTEAYYPESIYPTSVRPAPVGSEATDMTQAKLSDGVVPSLQNPYVPYSSPYTSGESNPYAPQHNYDYPATSKAFDKPDTNYGYNTPYTPPQFSGHMPNQTYTNPYYSGSGTQNANTIVSDSQIPYYNSQSDTNSISYNTNQYNMYNPYGLNQVVPAQDTVSTVSSYDAPIQADLSASLAQMQVNAPKSEFKYEALYGNYPQAHTSISQETKCEPATSYGDNYSQTYYSLHYPQANTPNMATYSHAGTTSDTNSVSSMPQSEYSNYPYSSDGNMTQNLYTSEPSYSYGVYSTSTVENPSEAPIYTIPEMSYSTSTITSSTVPQQPYPSHEQKDTTITPNLDVFDKPIKSHARGEALSSMNYPSYPYDPNVAGYSSASNENTQPQNFDQNIQPTSMAQQSMQPNSITSMNPSNNAGYGIDQSNTGYMQTNMSSYEQNQPPTPLPNYPNSAESNVPISAVYVTQTQNYQVQQNHPGYSYNSATGTYDYAYGSQNSFTSYGNQEMNCQNQNWSNQAVYSNAGNCQTIQSPSEEVQSSIGSDSQNYYHTPYGYQTGQSNEVVQKSEEDATNYGANVNQPTYMLAGQKDTSVTFSNNQVPTTVENNEQNTATNKPEIQPEIKVDEQKEVSAFDLLSDIDFTVEHKPLTPEIKVPQINENAIKKPTASPEPKVVKVRERDVREDPIERPMKRDIFSDPLLLNKFTQEVKNLQQLVDSITNVTVGGLTVLDSKWKKFEEAKVRENVNKTKTLATQHTQGSIVTEVVPYDGSRLTLKSDPDVYINASYYKQLAPWCIPLVIAKNPSVEEQSVFWRAMLENNISCIVCLLSEIEIQGYCYWPTAKGQSLEFGELKVTLDEVFCSVNWTERKLFVTSGKDMLNLTHYQINVFPAKIICSPLVLLADKVLTQTYENRLTNQLLTACIHCGPGAGRSSLLALLIAVMCEVRAGQIHLCDTIDACCVNLYKHRTNVLEDTKYLADAYRTALFYVQGVLCSGTAMFSGEAVTLPSGASVLPPVTPTSTSQPATAKQKFSKESFEEMKQSPGLKTGDMKDPLNFLDPLWSLKKK